MSAAELRHASSPSQTYLLVPILLLFILLVIAVLRAPTLISNAGIGSAIIVASPLILACEIGISTKKFSDESNTLSIETDARNGMRALEKNKANAIRVGGAMLQPT